MAFAETTLASAVGQQDTFVTLASATSVAAGRFFIIDGELMQANKDYVTGVAVNVARGLGGTVQTTHVSGARVTHGLASDFPVPAPGQSVNYPVAGRSRSIVSLSATATLTLPVAGSDLLVILNGTSVIALTIPVPTKEMDGCELTIVSNGVAAHTLTFTGGLSGAGSNYDVITINATAPAAFKFVAVNELWYVYVAAAMGGTVTNLVGSVA